VKRPGFLRLMNALKPKPPFEVLIMSEESRLGREQIETAYALKQIITAGVRIFYYLEDRERTLESPTDKLLLSVTAFADEMEREKARQRTQVRARAPGAVLDIARASRAPSRPSGSGWPSSASPLEGTEETAEKGPLLGKLHGAW